MPCSLGHVGDEVAVFSNYSCTHPVSGSLGAWMQIRKRKRRLDEVCLELHPEHSRNVIQSWIVQGRWRLLCPP